jgi:hypothetical protein
MANEKQLDLIDRLKLLDSLGYDPMKFWEITPESTFGIVLNSPTVDAVEVVHGRWMVNNKEASCSACKFTTFEWAEWTFNYCPNCGARMCL